MLQTLNHMVKGWLAWAVLALVAVTFVSLGVGYYRSGRSSQVLAKVNGAPIYQQQVAEVVQQQQRELRVEPAELATLRKQALDNLIQRTLREQAIQGEGFAVSEEQVKRTIQSLPDFQEDGHFSPQRLSQLLSANQLHAASLISAVSQGMLTNQQRFIFSATNFVLPDELAQFVGFIDQQRSFRYLSIDGEHLATPDIATQAIASYYQIHQSKLLSQPQVSLQYVSLSLETIRQHITVSEQHLHQFYEENLAEYTAPAQYRVQHLLLAKRDTPDEEKIKKVEALIAKGQPFDTLVKQYSDDLVSQSDSPWVTRGVLEPALDNRLPDLVVGKVVGPIDVEQGVAFIQLLAFKPAKTLAFQQVKSTIKQRIINQRAQSQFLKKSEMLAELSYQYPDSLEEVSEALALPIASTALFSKQAPMPAPFSNKKPVEKIIWSDDVYQQENNSVPIELSTGNLVVLRVNQKRPPVQLSLSEATPLIRQRLIKQKLTEEKQALTQSLLTMLKQGKQQDLEALIEARHLRWTQKQLLRRDMMALSPTSLEGIAARLAFEAKSSKPVSMLADSKLGNIIVELLKVNDTGTESLSPEKKSLLARQLASRLGLERYQRYLDYLAEHANVELQGSET